MPNQPKRNTPRRLKAARLPAPTRPVTIAATPSASDVPDVSPARETPLTPLAAKLLAARERLAAAGVPFLSADEIRRELDERRGERS